MEHREIGFRDNAPTQGVEEPVEGGGNSGTRGGTRRGGRSEPTSVPVKVEVSESKEGEAHAKRDNRGWTQPSLQHDRFTV